MVGERYTHERCVFDGDPQSNDWHLECEEDMDEAMAADGGHCFEFSPWEAARPEKRLGFTNDAATESQAARLCERLAADGVLVFNNLTGGYARSPGT